MSQQHSLNAKPMRDALLTRIHEAMAVDADIFFVTADFGSPILDRLRSDYPDRVVNVGIAEQNLINVSAGLALEGYKVFAYAIAPFITMRCYEQVRVSLAILSKVRRMNVTLIGVGAGYSYVVSGPTHQCFEDITLMRALPTFAVYSPSDHISAAAMFDVAIAHEGPSYLRLDAQVLPVLYDAVPNLSPGFHVHKEGTDICLVATGYMVHTALKAADRLQDAGLNVGVIDLFTLASVNEEVLYEALKNFSGVVSMEEGFRGRGGLDAMLYDFTTRYPLRAAILPIGVNPDYRFELGTRESLHEQIGIGVNAVYNAVTKFAARLAALHERA